MLPQASRPVQSFESEAPPSQKRGRAAGSDGALAMTTTMTVPPESPSSRSLSQEIRSTNRTLPQSQSS